MNGHEVVQDGDEAVVAMIVMVSLTHENHDDGVVEVVVDEPVKEMKSEQVEEEEAQVVGLRLMFLVVMMSMIVVVGKNLRCALIINALFTN